MLQYPSKEVIYVRLDKLVADCGIGSRKEIKQMLRSGRITVDGAVVKDGATQVDPASALVVADAQLLEYRQFVYLMMNKPAGVVSATRDNHFQTVIDLVPPKFSHYDLFPAGRLDRDTEGLLLITNDGAMAHRLLSPRSHVPKVYIAVLDLPVVQSDVDTFLAGIVLDDGYLTLPATLSGYSQEELHMAKVTIMEGKFHQVKRMFADVGKKVQHLKRVSFGGLTLDPTMMPGDVRELTKDELAALEGQA